MRLTPEHQRRLIMESLIKAEGNRDIAAKSLGMSLRTLNRHIKDLDLYIQMEAMGLMRGKGPPRGVAKGMSMVRMRILAHIRKNKGNVEFGKLALEIYNEDSRPARQRLYSAMEDLRNQGRVVVVEDGRWRIIEEPVLTVRQI